MLRFRYAPYRLNFRNIAITSREAMTHKDTYILQVRDTEKPEVIGTGEIALFRGLSEEDMPDFNSLLTEVLKTLTAAPEYNVPYSSIRFGVETALASLGLGGGTKVFPSGFTRRESGILINGLIWMGKFDEMKLRIRNKIEQGFGCIKLKIGGINFDEELELIGWLRSEYSGKDLIIRLDANGSFGRYHFDHAMKAMRKLSEFDIHSIEQPFPTRHIESTLKACQECIIPIALDEQLIGMTSGYRKSELLDYLNPQFLVIKPSLCGGFVEASEWIAEAERRDIGWWITSALESAIGLNAIAQWTATFDNRMPQGLGTGELYVNDFRSPIKRTGEWLAYDSTIGFWALPENIDWVDV